MKKINLTMQYLWDLWTATQIKLAVLFSIIWGGVSAALGGIDAPIAALFWIVGLDFMSGVFAGCKTGTFESSIGIKGLTKKVVMFGLVGFMFLLETAMGANGMRNMAISGFAIIEAMSVIENVDRMGYGKYIPKFIRGWLARIQEEREVKED